MSTAGTNPPAVRDSPGPFAGIAKSWKIEFNRFCNRATSLKGLRNGEKRVIVMCESSE
jgi:hypothetical protein